MDLKGQKMLKVCSILMIIGGAISLLVSILGLVTLSAAASLGAAMGANLDAELGMSMGAAYAVMVVAIVASGIELAAGIVGVQTAKMPSVAKIKASLILGLVVALLNLAASIYSMVMGGSFANEIVSLLLGLVIPVLYIVGIIQYKNALLELLGGGE